MPKLKVLSGKDLIDIFASFGFHIIGQTGSHVKMRCHKDNNKQTLTIPLHKEIDKGLLKAIFNQGSMYISEQELKKYFFTE
ncbi:MAG: type II toxin-antitoxin system HicA family toxin [Minisyncoccia bacterium]